MMKKWLNSLALTACLAIESISASVTTQPSEIPCVQKNHPIVYLMATPCSGMVELLRMMHERGDMTVMHIPANLVDLEKREFFKKQAQIRSYDTSIS